MAPVLEATLIVNVFWATAIPENKNGKSISMKRFTKRRTAFAHTANRRDWMSRSRRNICKFINISKDATTRPRFGELLLSRTMGCKDFHCGVESSRSSVKVAIDNFIDKVSEKIHHPDSFGCGNFQVNADVKGRGTWVAPATGSFP